MPSDKLESMNTGIVGGYRVQSSEGCPSHGSNLGGMLREIPAIFYDLKKVFAKYYWYLRKNPHCWGLLVWLITGCTVSYIIDSLYTVAAGKICLYMNILFSVQDYTLRNLHSIWISLSVTGTVSDRPFSSGSPMNLTTLNSTSCTSPQSQHCIL